MEPEKAERVASLVKERDDMQIIIERYGCKPILMAGVSNISPDSPLHSQLLSVFQNRLKYVESELDKE